MRRTCLALLLATECFWGGSVHAQPTGADPVILLVPGMAWQIEKSREAGPGQLEKSPAWRSLIAALNRDGYTFGGVIRPKGVQLRLPECLHAAESAKPSREARLFFLEFSDAANTDGLASRALELAQCLPELQRFTGRPIYIVAHSAGGLVARVVMQKACPGIRYEGEVRRLITLGTPHLGAQLATEFGDLLGVRASSLRPDAPLIHRLNNECDLPRNCQYAALIVRGLPDGVRDAGAEYEGLINLQALADLPVDYREGGDQVVHVRSANLRWANCARDFEEKTSQAAHSFVLRVRSPSNFAALFSPERVHVSCLADPTVQTWVAKLLADDGKFWTGLSAENMDKWVDFQVRWTVYGILEAQILAQSRLTEVTSVAVDQLKETLRDRASRRYDFVGTVESLAFRRKRDQLQGTLHVTLDRFGRIVQAKHEMR